MPGLTSEGFEVLRLPEIVAELSARHRTDYGTRFDTRPQTPIGQLDGVLAEREAALWELLERIFLGTRVFGADTMALEDMAVLLGTVRLPAAPTYVDVVFSGTPGTVIPAATEVPIANTTRVFTTQSLVTIGGGGTSPGRLISTVTGPVGIIGPQDWTEPSIAGLVSITNTLDGVTGRDVETPEALRARLLSMFVGPGNSVESITAAVLRVPGVTEVRTVENPRRYVDRDGRPAHSFEVIVVGGTNQAVADAIWASKPAGIEAYGLTLVSVVDSEGDAHDVGLTRPADVLVWIEVDVTPRVVSTAVGSDATTSSTYPLDGAALIEAAIVAIEPGLRAGQSFPSWMVLDAIAGALPPESLERVSVRLGLAASPTSDATIVTTARQRVALDSARILVREV